LGKGSRRNGGATKSKGIRGKGPEWSRKERLKRGLLKKKKKGWKNDKNKGSLGDVTGYLAFEKMSRTVKGTGEKAGGA